MKTHTLAIALTLSLFAANVSATSNYSNHYDSKSKSSSSSKGDNKDSGSRSSYNPYADWDKLFTAQVKVSEYQPYGQNAGDDIYLNKGNTNEGTSANVDWQEYDTNSYKLDFDATFSWMLTRTDDVAEFTFGDSTLSFDTETGTWEGLGLYFNTSGNRSWLYDHAWLNVSIDEWNNDPLKNAVSYTSKLNEVAYFEVYNSDMLEIESISGTMTFSWDMNYWSKYYSDNPDNQFSFWFKGLDYNDVEFSSSRENDDITNDSDFSLANLEEQSASPVGVPPLGAAALLAFVAGIARSRKS
jgi:hypothetical protein